MLSPISISSSMSTPDAERSATRPPRKTSEAHNLTMREIIKPWAGLSSQPPGCWTVSYSSWSKFRSSSESSKSKDDMLASVLWNSRGTSPDYNPPVTEWCNLGIEAQAPAVVDSNTNARPIRKRERLRKSSGSASSWSTACSCGSIGLENEENGISFMRVPVSKVSTSSLLTISFQSAPGTGLWERMSPSEVLAKEMKERMLQADMLPSAFDSDSEDEEDDV